MEMVIEKNVGPLWGSGKQNDNHNILSCSK